MSEHTYLCIDLKSFYASVECVMRGLDPMTTNLIVADPERKEGTICLAISPAMKALGIKNRCRVFEIPPNISYIQATPRMQLYIDYAAEVYAIYLKYISKNDIHVYSIDEAFLDVTTYLKLYQLNPKELAVTIMNDIASTLGIRATCGIGTNMYLAKIALDITAKHSADFIGVLDEELYREQLWDHTPLTDFWRIGAGTEKKLEKYGIHTMKDIANCDEDFLYKLFGIDAELLIDHAWGREYVTIADIKNYHSGSKSITSGQVLMRDYNVDEARIIVKEMVDLLCLDLVDAHLLTTSVTLHIGYTYKYRDKSVNKTVSLDMAANADSVIIPAVVALYDEIVSTDYPIRRINLSCNHLVPEENVQYSFFSNTEELERNRKLQEAELSIKKKFGKGAILKGISLQDAATTLERNKQIGGHKSGV